MNCYDKYYSTILLVIKSKSRVNIYYLQNEIVCRVTILVICSSYLFFTNINQVNIC